MNNHTKPLLSYLLFTYNQENYIREAVESAFAQTYSPLEIIISDDHSTDNTWAIIKELFDKYNGLHKIIINRNSKNLGIANHVNKVMSMAKGELFIMAAGDDIAFSNRTQTLFNYWSKFKGEVFAFTSSTKGIDSDGNNYLRSNRLFFEEKINPNLESFITYNNWCGAGTAYDRILYDTFKNIQVDVNEDRVYLTRAWLLGKSMTIKEPLLYYRFGGISNNNSKNMTSILIHNYQWYENAYKQLLIDLETINYPFEDKQLEFIKMNINFWHYSICGILSKTFYRKIYYIKQLLKFYTSAFPLIKVISLMFFPNLSIYSNLILKTLTYFFISIFSGRYTSQQANKKQII